MAEPTTPKKPAGYSIRRATLGDLETMVEHRCAMMREIRECDEDALKVMSNAFREWLAKRLSSEEYLGWFAVAPDRTIAAGAGLWLLDWPPHLLPSGIPGDRRAYLLNVFTEPAHRKRGLSRAVVQTALEWCRESGIKTVSLHASKFGWPLYESLGFIVTNEMRITL